jgi:hypothetical protein
MVAVVPPVDSRRLASGEGLGRGARAVIQGGEPDLRCWGGSCSPE